MEENLQHPGLVSDDLPFGDLVIPRHPSLVRDPSAGQFLLSPADHRYFRDGVDAVREQRLALDGALPEHMVDRQSPLLHRGGGQGREAYAVARGIDVSDSRLKILADCNPSPRGRLQAGRRQVEQVRVGLPPGGVKQPLRAQTFAALQPHLYQSPLADPDLGDLFAQTEDGFLSPHVIAQGLHDLVVHEVKYGGPLVDDCHPDAERRQHRGVLKPDDAGPHHDHVARDAATVSDLIRIYYPGAERNLGRARRARTASDQDVVRHHRLRPLPSFDLQSVRAGKAGGAVQHDHSVSSELLSDDGHLTGDDRIHALHQICDADLLFEFVVAAVKGALAVAGQIEHGFAERLAGDGSRVQRHTADHLAAVNNRHALAELGACYRALLTGGAAADDD